MSGGSLAASTGPGVTSMAPAWPLFNVLEEWLGAIDLIPAEAASALAAGIVFVGTFVAITVVGYAILLPLLKRGLKRRGLDKHARRPIVIAGKLTIVFTAVAVAFGLAGFGNFLVAMTGIAAALALAIGFATQSIIANVVAGVFIYADKPFRIGDWIEWGEHAGVVEDISLRVTRVRTFDNELLTVPNRHLTDGVIKNPVDAEHLRVKVDLGIGYDDDIQQASEIVLEEADAHPEILDDPAPSVRLTELGDSDVVLQARLWIGDPSRADVVRIRGEYVRAVKEHFDEVGIDIPYPIRTLEGDLHVDGVPGATDSGK